MGVWWYMAAGVLLAGGAMADNVTDVCLEPWDSGPWGAALEDWASGAAELNHRHGRVMSLPPAPGYYVTDRVDRPPPPPHLHPPGPPIGPPASAQGPVPYDEWTPPGGKILNRPGSGAPQKEKPFKPSPAYPTPPNQIPPSTHQNPHRGPGLAAPPSQQYPSPTQQYPSYPNQPPSQQTPSNQQQYPPYPNQPSQSYPSTQQYPNQPPSQSYPSAQQHYPSHPNQLQSQQYPSNQNPPTSHQPAPPQQSASDRIDEPPRKQVTETDLYLLTAIEKLVYRVDLMEKRLRKLEENVHYLVAGAEPKPEPCVANFTRVAGTCYHFSGEALDWKSANLACRKLRANLIELDSEEERRKMVSTMLGDKRIRGLDVWTGGLNPGLLWIWAHSARPVLTNSTTAHGSASGSMANGTVVTIVGQGRCLALVHDPAINNYVYRGQDCAFRHRYICEKGEDKAKLSNEIERVARGLRHSARQARLLLAGGAGGVAVQGD